jgi:hypothetical protein
MKRRLFNILATVSLLLAAATAVLWPVSYPRYRPGFVDLSWDFPGAGAVSESGQFIVWAGRLPPKPVPFVAEWSVPGLSYRRMAEPYGAVFVAVPHGVLLAALLLLPAVALRRGLRSRRLRRRAAAGLCPACGYDLRATPGNCPECGRPAGPPPPKPLPPRRVLHRLPRRAQRRVRGAVLVTAATAVVLLIPTAVTTVTWRPIEWRRESGNARRAWGAYGRTYYYYSLVRNEHAGPLPGETGSASKGEVLVEDSCGPVHWVRSKHDSYYGQGAPQNELDLGDLSRYRRVTAETRSDYWVDAWVCAAALLLPVALALANAFRRYVVHGYWFASRAG